MSRSQPLSGGRIPNTIKSDPFSRLIENQFTNMQITQKQQEQRRKDREAAIQAQIAAEMETEKEKDEDTLTYKVKVSEFKCANPMHRNGIAALQIGDSLTNAKGAAAQDPWVVVAKKSGGRWVADDVKYQQIVMQDSINPDLQKIDGKKVLFYGPDGRTKIPAVRRSAYAKFLQGDHKEDTINSLETVLASLENMIKVATGSVDDKSRRMKAWMERHPAQASALTQALSILESNVGAQTLFKQTPDHACHTFDDQTDEWNKAMGRPTDSKPVRPDNPIFAEEKEHKQWLRGIPILDSQGQPFCASPSSKDASGNSPFNAYGDLYHGLTEMTQLKDKLQGRDGRAMPDQRAYSSAAFCAQRETTDQCKDSNPAKMPLSETKRSASDVCEFNEEEDQCAPRGIKKGSDMHAWYHGRNQVGGFADSELKIVKRRQQLRRNLSNMGNLSRRERREAKRMAAASRTTTNSRFHRGPELSTYKSASRR